jgi:hypothetical protein
MAIADFTLGKVVPRLQVGLDEAEEKLTSPLLVWNGFSLLTAQLWSSRRTLIRIRMRQFFLVLSELALELHEGLAESLKKVVTFLLCGERATRHVQGQ